MVGRRTLVSGVALLAVGAVSVVAYVFGGQQTLSGLTVERVSPDQAATAMQNDSFFSVYNSATLVMNGTVVAVHTNGSGETLQLATRGPFQALVQLGQPDPSVRIGDTVTIVSEGAEAQRQSSAVLLAHCVLVSMEAARS
jgi:hypothetical protein